MYFDLHCMLALALSGFLLLGVGFTLRKSEWGIALIAIGALLCFSPLYYRIYMTFA